MVRKLAIAAFALTALSSGIAQALGLGEATVSSSLNQPLAAEIELVNIRDLEENEILTGLADREEFQRVGVERAFFLSDLRFKVELNSNGKAVIKVSSSKPVREPFLNFLVEVNWPSGRLLREYALLIDPPVYSEAKSLVKPTSAPAKKSQKASSVDRSSASDASAKTAADYGDDTYGPTRSNDTMWAIALKTRPNSSVSPQQMMLAIQDLNPDAFINNNVNRLKKGRVLRLPDAELIHSRSARQAISEFDRQNRDLRKKSKPKKPDSVSADQVQDQLRIVVDQTSESKLSSGESSGVSQPGTTALTDGSDILVQEQIDLISRENEELKNRFAELQKQLETLHRLVTLKDDQIAVLQAQTAINQESKSVSDTKELTTTVLPVSPEETATGEAAAIISPPVADAIVPPGEEDKPVTSPVPPAPQPEESVLSRVFDSIKNNALAFLALLAGALVLIFLALRRSGKKEGDEVFEEQKHLVEKDTVIDVDSEADESIEDLVEDEGESDPVAEADVYIAYQKMDQAVKVLEEALEKEPENYEYRLKLLEVLGESKKSDKFNVMFNTLSACGVAAVVSKANDIKARYDIDMTESEVSLDDLESELLSGGSFEPADDISDTVLGEGFDLDIESDIDIEDDLDIDFDLSDFDLEESGISEEISGEELDEIEFDVNDLPDDIVEAEKGIDEVSGSSGDGDSLDLDDGMTDFDGTFDEDSTVDIKETSASTEEYNLEETDSDQELNDNLAKEVVGNLNDEEQGLEGSELLFEGEDLGLKDPGFSQDDAVLDEGALLTSADLEGQESEGLAKPVMLSADNLEEDIDDDFDFLTDTDEAATKLDLARAYVDMGDKEGAKEILEEVAEEGSSEQQQEANNLLNGLD